MTPVGSPGFTAPEVTLGGGAYTEKVDIWAVGSVLLFMVTGTPPAHVTALSRGTAKVAGTAQRCRLLEPWRRPTAEDLLRGWSGEWRDDLRGQGENERQEPEAYDARAQEQLTPHETPHETPLIGPHEQLTAPSTPDETPQVSISAPHEPPPEPDVPHAPEATLPSVTELPPPRRPGLLQRAWRRARALAPTLGRRGTLCAVVPAN